MARLHLAVGLGFVLAGVLWLAVTGVTASSVVRSLLLLVLGGFTVVIFGTSRMLIAGMAGRDVTGPRGLAWAALGLAATGALGSWATWASSRVSLAGSVAWALGLLIHVGIIALSARGPRLRGASADAIDPLRNRLVLVLDWASLAFGGASALTIPFASAGALPWLSAIHLLLPGFVVLTLVAVACRVLPRLSGVAFPRWLLGALAATLPLGPALLAWGVAWGGAAFVAGAAIEATGLALFGGATLYALATSSRPRASFLALGASAISIVVGVLLGVQFVVAPGTRMLGPAHGLLNVLGFVGLFVLGTSFEMYAPAIRAGLRAFRIQTRVTIGACAMGLSMTVGGSISSKEWPTQIGLLLYALGIGIHLAGVIAVVIRSHRTSAIGPIRVTSRRAPLER